jgi:hypothetical protein
MKISGIFLAAALGGMALPVLAQDLPSFPLVQDIPPSDGYGANPPDVLGIPFGASRADAEAALQAAYPGIALQDDGARMGLADGRGNQVAFLYTYQISAHVDGTPSEDLTVHFTTAATGGRVYEIQRRVDYPQGHYADMNALRASITAKYGDRPTLVETSPGDVEITYTWEKRPVVSLGVQDRTKRAFNAPLPINVDPCINLSGLSTVGLSPYSNQSGALYTYSPPGKRPYAPGTEACIGTITFSIYTGNNDNTVSGLRVDAIDFDRAARDARIVDTYLARALEEAAKGVKGQGAPKL